MTETKFVEFPKLARLSRDCVITEKIDGTNASITITEDGQFLTGSRTHWITPEDDNQGFSKWALLHKEELMLLGKGTHFGEWWGNGIQRGYNLAKDDKRFSLFNTFRWCLFDSEPKQLKCADPRIVKYQKILPKCVGLVPVLYTGPMITSAWEQCLEDLQISGSVAAKGFLKPEGIVLFHIAGNVGFKKTIEKDYEPKSLNK